MTEQLSDLSDLVVPPSLVIDALRDSGYKNAAYALAELLDNSIQANADAITLLCVEGHNPQEPKRKFVESIAVLDNGDGMDPHTLRNALQFGNGTRLGDRSGIGRFGMGLPNSSVSQCRRVDVYSWQNGPTSCVATHLDVTSIQNGQAVIPAPEPAVVPENIRRHITNFPEQSGTLVVWTELDRLTWKQGKTVIRNTEQLIGRIYRHFLDIGSPKALTIELIDADVFGTEVSRNLAKPVDPLYLMVPTQTPPPYDKKPMFEPFGDQEYDIKGHRVTVRFSIAKNEARGGDNAGMKAWGQHAKHQVGVSLVRAGRELALDTNLCIAEVTERWWGAEISFPPDLDEVFGVTNNKQAANNFTAMAERLKEGSLEDGDGSQFADDTESLLAPLVKGIDKELKNIRTQLKKNQANRRKGKKKRHPTSSVIATGVTGKRKGDNPGASDSDETGQEKERVDKIKTVYIADGENEQDAEDHATEIVKRKLKYELRYRTGLGKMLFGVESRAGVIFVNLNVDHPAYKYLVSTLADPIAGDEGEPSLEDLIHKVEEARTALELMFFSWARMEDEAKVNSASRASLLDDVRVDWGRMAHFFIEALDPDTKQT